VFVQFIGHFCFFAGIFRFYRARTEERFSVPATKVSGHRASADEGRRIGCQHEYQRIPQTEALLCPLGDENLQLAYNG